MHEKNHHLIHDYCWRDHIRQMVMWGIVITLHSSSTLSSVIAYHKIFLKPIRTKLDRNVDWVFLHKVFFVIGNLHEQEAIMFTKKGVICFLYVSRLFFNQFWSCFTFIIKFSFSNMSTNLFMVLTVF